MNTPVKLTNGGIATVLIGTTGYVKEFAKDPRVMFIDCQRLDGALLSDQVPANTKVLIITEGLGQLPYQWGLSYARQKRIPYVIKRSNQAIYDYLTEITREVEKPTIEEVKETQTKGKLNELESLIDWNLSNAENARNLEKVCVEKNIRTTFASLAQFVANKRRAKGISTTPKSARSKLDVSVEFLEEAIKNLNDMKEFLIATVEENRILRDKVDKFKKLLD